MSTPCNPFVLDIGFFRIIGLGLVTLAVTAGSITLSLTLKSTETVAPSNIIANLTTSVAEESQ